MTDGSSEAPIKTLHFVLSGIPLYAFYQGEEIDVNAPYAFVLHSFRGNATDVFGQCERLAAKGLTAIAFDLRNHGARMNDPTINGRWEACKTDEEFCNMLSDMYVIIRGSAQDISLLIDGLALRFGFTAERAGVTGVSLGAHTAFMAMARDTRILVGAPMLGSANFERLSAHRIVRYGKSLSYFEEYKTKRLMPLLKRYDPSENPSLFADRPLLILNGQNDDMAPPFCNEAFYQNARKAYRNPSLIEFKIYENVNHQGAREIEDEANAWLCAFLLNPAFLEAQRVDESTGE